MLLHAMTGPVTVSHHSGVGTVEEVGCGSIVGACACHPTQISRLSEQIISNTMTTTTKMKRQCTLSTRSKPLTCNFAQSFFPHSRARLRCKLDGSRWRHLHTDQVILRHQHVRLARLDPVDRYPKKGLRHVCKTPGVDVMFRRRASHLNRELNGRFKRHQNLPLLDRRKVSSM